MVGAPKKADRITDEEFLLIWERSGRSPTGVAEFLGWPVRSVFRRRGEMAKRGFELRTVPRAGTGAFDWQAEAPAYTPRIKLEIRDGYIVTFSDVHVWPGIRSFATDALMIVLKELKPKIVVANGDVLDGATISRHDPLGWGRLPDLRGELYAAKAFLSEIEGLTPKAEHIFCAGNHDSRFDRRLSKDVPEFQGVPGFKLQEQFRDWRFCYSLLVNEDTEPSFFLHAHMGGVHAPRNNVLRAGCTTFTGHLHSQKSMPVTTLLHEWDGVDGGMLADRDGPQFGYVASRPVDWREGFAVQRYDKEGLRYPAELCRVIYSRKVKRAVWRGEVILERGIV